MYLEQHCSNSFQFRYECYVFFQLFFNFLFYCISVSYAHILHLSENIFNFFVTLLPYIPYNHSNNNNLNNNIMKNRERMPKKDYFKMRLEQAIASGNDKKAKYFQSRLDQMAEKVESSKLSHKDAVRKSVKVLNAPGGTVNMKQSYITQKLESEGFTSQEATTIFLEALNIASDGELLRSAGID